MTKMKAGAKAPAKPSLRQLLAQADGGPVAVSLLDELAHDPWIGPDAPGDGDIVQWYFLAALLALAQLFKLTPSQREALVRDRSGGESSRRGQPAFDVKGSRLQRRLREQARKLIAADDPRIPAWDVFLDAVDEFLIDCWGGRQVRVHAREKVLDPVGKVGRELQKGTPISKIPGIVGVSRATVYRILRRNSKTR